MNANSHASRPGRYFDTRRRRVERDLGRHLATLGVPPRLLRAMRYSLLGGGKRLRPLLCIAAAEACGGGLATALTPACALELIHTYSLIHDDLPAMDDDSLRRGRATNHIVFGEAMAILAGDALLTEAFHLIARARSPLAAPARLQIVAELGQAAGATGMVAGQADDLRGERRRWSQPQIEALHHRKTGALIRASVRAGAIAAGADARTLQALTKYGERIGPAFQIADDILDEEASTRQTGKSRGRDRVRGKSTFVTRVGVGAAKQRANALLSQALRSIRHFDQRADPLRELARYIVERAA